MYKQTWALEELLHLELLMMELKHKQALEELLSLEQLVKKSIKENLEMMELKHKQALEEEYVRSMYKQTWALEELLHLEQLKKKGCVTNVKNDDNAGKQGTNSSLPSGAREALAKTVIVLQMSSTIVREEEKLKDEKESDNGTMIDQSTNKHVN